MVEQEEREVKPHREETEVVNLGIGEEKIGGQGQHLYVRERPR